MSRLVLIASLLVGISSAASALAGGDPNETVIQADQVLAEIMAIPAKQIPEHLLSQAQGVAIIPDVIKVGFIAGARRGHGVVLVRDNDGEWSLPQFITLTGGSVGWQAGVQGSDIVLVFTTKKGVEGLLHGKFTIGADAAVAAGPLGRDAAAATDERFKAEILSYSRSRGLFLGVSIDGSVLEVDHSSHAFFYGSMSNEVPKFIPQSAAKLRQDLVALTPNMTMTAAAPGAAVVAVHPQMPDRVETLRASLDRSSRQLLAIVSSDWQQYLALPREVYSPVERPNVETLRIISGRYAKVIESPNYKALASRPEFQATNEILREYTEALAGPAGTAIQLPPPPGGP